MIKHPKAIEELRRQLRQAHRDKLAGFLVRALGGCGECQDIDFITHFSLRDDRPYIKEEAEVAIEKLKKRNTCQ